MLKVAHMHGLPLHDLPGFAVPKSSNRLPTTASTWQLFHKRVYTNKDRLPGGRQTTSSLYTVGRCLQPRFQQQCWAAALNCCISNPQNYAGKG